MRKMIKFQFELPEDRVKELEELMRKAKISTRKDLFNSALTLLEWAVHEKEAGRAIASIDEGQRRYKELVMPSLTVVPTRP
jgi:metal-responsive CopG/Arc/MetJ family transcriptional regulator